MTIGSWSSSHILAFTEALLSHEKCDSSNGEEPTFFRCRRDKACDSCSDLYRAIRGKGLHGGQDCRNHPESCRSPRSQLGGSPTSRGTREDDPIVEEIVGGITNELMRINFPLACRDAIGLDKVALRIYGKATDLVCDRELEKNLVTHLQTFSFAKVVYRRFSMCSGARGRMLWGQLEEWIPGFACNPRQLRDNATSTMIAQEIAKLHCIPVPEEFKDVPYFDVSETHFKIARKWLVKLQQYDLDETGHRVLLNLGHIERLMKELGSRRAWNTVVSRDRNLGQMRIQLSRSDIQLLEQEWEETPLDDVIFAIRIIHGDVLCGNILMDTDPDGESASVVPKSVRLIDYDYVNVGTPAYDIANHLCEWVGFDAGIGRYMEHFPTSGRVESFIRDYILAVAEKKEVRGLSKKTLHRLTVRMKEQVLYNCVLSHVYWGVWALIKDRSAAPGFDYLTFGFQRLTAALHPMFNPYHDF